ncbi:hypothetical protein E4U28_007312 [Claviceps purpurea]|nr:hypothetical protein E4U28_007312 [Claviceps purpurea]
MYPDEKFTDNHSEDQIRPAAVITQVFAAMLTPEKPCLSTSDTIFHHCRKHLGDDGSSTYLIFAVVVGEFLVLHIKTMSPTSLRYITTYVEGIQYDSVLVDGGSIVKLVSEAYLARYGLPAV